MSDTAFDTLGAARRLKAAGIVAEQADAIVEVMVQSANQLVTVERFNAGLAMLRGRIDKVEVRIDAVRTEIDAVRTEMRADIARSHLLSVGIIIAANALMTTILGILLAGGPHI